MVPCDKDNKKFERHYVFANKSAPYNHLLVITVFRGSRVAHRMPYNANFYERHGLRLAYHVLYVRAQNLQVGGLTFCSSSLGVCALVANQS